MHTAERNNIYATLSRHGKVMAKIEMMAAEATIQSVLKRLREIAPQSRGLCDLFIRNTTSCITIERRVYLSTGTVSAAAPANFRACQLSVS